ncbi:hypothetical protein PsorP6_015775 [Peronosclerospora sorghi]|uniref:Uncharacterized protein n=1 Tax=Peronosclerospora sorghi TaxID=230839 RepID=A0ACC0WNM2_9STRA|nr:hypothetical protein PsorP6_015775 [Peronosclerospora sorghi]
MARIAADALCLKLSLIFKVPGGGALTQREFELVLQREFERASKSGSMIGLTNASKTFINNL